MFSLFHSLCVHTCFFVLVEKQPKVPCSSTEFYLFLFHLDIDRACDWFRMVTGLQTALDMCSFLQAQVVERAALGSFVCAQS